MYGLNIDPTNPQGNPTGGELRDLGVQMARYTFKDSSANPSGQPDPNQIRFYSSKLQEYSSNGISSLIILSYETYPNKPVFSASDEEWDAYINIYLQRVRQIAQVLAPWRPAFQIWNEPDVPPSPSYEPSLREAVYGRMLSQARATIKAVDSTVTVVGAGLASGDPGWWSRVVASQPGRALLDVNALHPYGQRPEPNWPNPTWGFGYVGDLINNYRAVFNGPWWITEIGVSSLNDEDQASYLRRFYGTITSQFSDSVKWVHWFCYSDGMVYPYGLLNGSGQRKPAYTAYQEITPDSPIPPPRPAYDVEYLSHNTPPVAVMGQTNAVTLRVRNTGYRIWPAGGPNPVRLGYHWHTLDGNILSNALWDDNRTSLPFDVRPDEEVTLTANLSIPRAAGDYEVRWDMVEEMITWFAWQGVPTLNVRMNVRATTPPPQPGTLQLSASHNNVTSGVDNLLLAIDNNPYTRWSTETPQRPGMWFQIDLGQTSSVSYVRLDNAVSPQDYPRGYVVKLSTDGQNWTTVAQNANNTQPVEVTFSSRSVRFVRIEQTGSDPIYWWSIYGLDIGNELRISATASHNSVLVGADNLNQALDGQLATRWSTRALQQPGMWFEIDQKQPTLIRGLRLEPGSSANDYPRGYIVKLSNDRVQWHEVARRDQNTQPLDINFTPRSTRYLRVEQTGRSDSFWWSIHEVSLKTVAVDSNLTLSASHNNVTSGVDNLLQATDGNPATRWSTETPQRPGMWVEIDLATNRLVTSLVLSNAGSTNDYPRGYVVRFSLDRTNWLEVARKDQNISPLELTFNGRCARYIRIEQTGQSDIYWWSINELWVTSEPAPQGSSGQVSATASHNNVLSGADNILQALNTNGADRWSTRALQQPGMWFEIDLNSILLVNGLTLDNTASPNDYPRGYVVRVSTDRQLWEEVARNNNNTQPLNVNFSPRCARYLRVEQTGRSDQFWWSIHRIGVRYPSG